MKNCLASVRFHCTADPAAVGRFAFALRNPVTTTVPIANPGLSTPAGSAVEWNHTEARQFFRDLAHDQALPKSLITGSSVQGTA